MLVLILMIAVDFSSCRLCVRPCVACCRLKWNGTALRPIWPGHANGTELYNHAGDDGMAPAAFDDYENENLAGKPEWAAVQTRMAAQLQWEVERWYTPNPPSLGR